mgnify:CR=1 FL=1
MKTPPIDLATYDSLCGKLREAAMSLNEDVRYRHAFDIFTKLTGNLGGPPPAEHPEVTKYRGLNQQLSDEAQRDRKLAEEADRALKVASARCTSLELERIRLTKQLGHAQKIYDELAVAWDLAVKLKSQLKTLGATVGPRV